jgi:hypothetical protein
MDKTIIIKLQKVISLLKHPDRISFLVKYYIKRFSDDRKASKGFYKHPYQIIFLAGMPMSATTWVKNLLARVPGYYSRPMFIPYKIAVKQDIVDSAFKYLPRKGYGLYKTHLNPSPTNIDCITRNGVKKIVVTLRDLRDVVISRYYRLIEFPKSPGDPHYIDYNKICKEEAINDSLNVVINDYVPWIEGWVKYAKQNPEKCHLVKFENLKANSKLEFNKLLNFYKIDIEDSLINEIIGSAKGKGDVKTNFSKAKSLPFGLSSNFRKGKSGEWKTEMTEKQIQRCREEFGKLLIDLEYEKDMNW